MKNIIRQLLVFFVFVVSLNLAAQTLPVITGQVKCQGRGVANVVVTNGFDCVSTDVAGKYTIPYHRDARFVYVTTPAGYLPQRDGSLPLFYQRITKGTSVYDFSLVKNSKNDDKHLFLVQADVQNSEAISPFVDKILVYQYLGIMNKPQSKAHAGLRGETVRLYNQYMDWYNKQNFK